ncbi:DUF4124 domain-containing protein [Marinagarivorans algicola]|uniref:DUF4124 domain-containing protein n=1 Tax=Marinagarivorans algicola TaxID=1513270 RepID=UPI0006B69A92|nr:DUF4124 domain-containing protein [Marinagarivorans algicola]
MRSISLLKSTALNSTVLSNTVLNNTVLKKTATLTRSLIACLVCCAGISTQVIANEVYKSVDENGKVTYSDNPIGTKIEEVDLPIINSAPAVEPQPYTPTTRASREQSSVIITSPSDKTQVPAGQRDLVVSAEANPPIGSGFSAQLYFNGKPFGPAQADTHFVIKEIIRGEHTLSVAVLNPRGKIISRSKSITVYVHRPRVGGR